MPRPKKFRITIAACRRAAVVIDPLAGARGYQSIRSPATATLLLPPAAAWVLDPVPLPRNRCDLYGAFLADLIRAGPGLGGDRRIGRATVRVFLTDRLLVRSRCAPAGFKVTLIVFAGHAAILHRIHISETRFNASLQRRILRLQRHDSGREHGQDEDEANEKEGFHDSKTVFRARLFKVSRPTSCRYRRRNHS